MPFTITERIQILHGQGVSVENIAVRLGIDPNDVIARIQPQPRSRGRPASGGACRECGAFPCHQRRKQ